MYQHGDSPGSVRAAWVRCSGGVGGALGFGGAIVAALAGALGGELFGWSTRPGITLALLALAVVGVSLVTTLPGALAAAVQSWAVYCGFVTHRFGELRVDVPDRQIFMFLMTLAIFPGLLGLLGIRLARSRAQRRVPPLVALARPGSSRWPTGVPGLVSAVTSASIPRQERDLGR